jgi:hypothetical protein
MKDNLLLGLLGHRNAGKSTTWYELFGYRVRTGSQIRELYLTKTEYVEVFLVSGSPEEKDTYVGDIIGNLHPRIVLCSMQYIDTVAPSLDYFLQNDYFLYVQWLNPGHHDQNNLPHADYLGIANKILSLDSTLSVRSGKVATRNRVQEIRDYLYGWAKSRNLIKT